MSVSQRRRLNKREELLPPVDEENDEEDEESENGDDKAAGFSVLLSGSSDGGANNNNNAVAKGKKKRRNKGAKKKNAATGEKKEISVNNNNSSKGSKSAAVEPATTLRKKDRRRKGKQEEDEELDALVAQIEGASLKTKGGTATIAVEQKGSTTKKSLERPLVFVNVKLLDSDMELKRLFDSRPPPRSGPHTHLVRRDPKWPEVRSYMRLQRLGVQADGAVVYGFKWHESYELAEKEFVACVASNQPNAFVLLLQRWGYHAGALLQLVGLSQRSGQFEQAYDLLARTLYFFERNLGSSLHLDDFNARLPYAHRENSAFHVALFKWCLMLNRKGCVSTALECSKLLLGWDVLDPLDVLLLVDVFALRAREYRWLVDMYERGLEHHHKRLKLYPNIAYGCAFALFHLGEMDKAQTRLEYALSCFPECAASLFKTLLIDAPFRSQAHFQALESGVLELDRVMQLYCLRSKDVWRMRALQEWIAKVAGKLQVTREDRQAVLDAYVQHDSLYLPSMVKHMMLSEEELEGNAGQIPLNMLQEALNLEAIDMPPPADSEVAMARLMGSDAHMPSLEDQIEELRRAPTANGLAMFLHSLMPWNVAPNAPYDPNEAPNAESWLDRARVLLGLPLHDEAVAAAAAAAREDEGEDLFADLDEKDDASSHTDDEE